MAPPTSDDTALRATSSPFVPRSLAPTSAASQPARLAPRAPAPDAAGGRGGARAGPAKATGPSEATPTSRKASRSRGKKQNTSGAPNDGRKKPTTSCSIRRSERWWKTSTACDPITLEPLCELEHPPFELARAEAFSPQTTATTKEKRKEKNEKKVDVDAAHLFDAAVLAEYVTRAKQFENPLNRVPMTARDCQRLDAHLDKCGLGKFNVFRAFRDAAAERAEAAQARAARENETAEAAARRIEQLQSELAASMFMDLRARRAREAATRASGLPERRRLRAGETESRTTNFRDANDERRRRGRTGAAVTREGALAMVDDDQGMRGRALAGRATDDGWQWEDASHLLENAEAEAFPALGDGTAPLAVAPPPARTPRSGPAAFPSLPSSGGAGGGPAGGVDPGGGFLWSAMAGAASAAPPPAARRPIRVQSLPRRPEDARPDPAEALPAGPSSAEDAEAAARRRRLAAAFGVSRPDARPSVFAASALEAFTKEVVKTARAFPREVADMEARLEGLAEDPRKKRVSLQAAPRRLRAVGHALAKTYGAASCAYGDEPRRRVDVFRTDATGFPSARLSDAVKYDAELAEAESAERSAARAEKRDAAFPGVAVRLAVTDVSEGVSEGDAFLADAPSDDACHARVRVHIGDGSEPHYSGNRATSSGENAAPRVGVQMRLSFAPEGARAARLGPSAGDEWFPEFTSWYSRGRWSRLEVRFSDFDDTDVLRREMSEFQGEFAWELVRRDGRSAGGGSLRRREDGDEAVAHFFRKEAYDAVVGKIGGGARGRFRARGATARGEGFEAEDAPTMGAAAAAAAAARRAAAAALARAGGRAGPRVPGAFGKEKGKEKVETTPAALQSAWDDDEDEDEEDREPGGSSNAFGASGEGTPREDVA